MTAETDDWIEFVNEMVQEFGETSPVTLLKANTSTYSTSTLTRTSSNDTEYAFYGCPIDFNVREIDSVTITTGEKMLWIPGATVDNVAIIPEVGDKIEFSSGTNFRILEVTSYRTQSVDCAYLLKIGV